MGLHHSPSIVLNGLVTYIDVMNPRSYPRTGTTLFDLSGNGNNFTVAGGLTFMDNPVNFYTSFTTSKDYEPRYRQSSAIAVDGAGVHMQSSFNSAISGLTGLTIELGLGQRQYNTTRVILSTQGQATNEDGFSIRTGGVAGSNPIDFEFRKGSTTRVMDFDIDEMHTTSDLRYGWNLITAKIWGVGGTAYGQLAANGSTFGGIESVALSGITSGNPMWLFKHPVGVTGNMWGSSSNAHGFAYMRVYNRLLSDEEMLQNYAATRGRYRT